MKGRPAPAREKEYPEGGREVVYVLEDGIAFIK